MLSNRSQRISLVYLFAAFLFCQFFAACLAPNDSRPVAVKRGQPIVNGTPSPAGYFPGVGALAIMSMYNYGEYDSFCTGSLIAPDMVLTAAHCLADFTSSSQFFFYIGNKISEANSGNVYEVSSYKIHEKYNNDKILGSLGDSYDIGVVKLATKITSVQPVKMVQKDEITASMTLGKEVLLMGYGLTDPNKYWSGGVKYQGKALIKQFGKSELWVSGEDNNGAQKCNGDSGGPTLSLLSPTQDAGATTEEWRIIGVASRAGENCVDGSIETRVDAYLDWIAAQQELPCGTSGAPDCGPPKKELGETCATSDDCQSALCVKYNGQQFCSQLCIRNPNNCPASLICAEVSGETTMGACISSKLINYGSDAGVSGNGDANISNLPSLPPDGGCALVADRRLQWFDVVVLFTFLMGAMCLILCRRR